MVEVEGRIGGGTEVGLGIWIGWGWHIFSTACFLQFWLFLLYCKPQPVHTQPYPFLYCAAISVFLTPVPSHRCMPVRMIFGSTNACSFELLKRCNFFVYDSPCFLTGWAIQDMLWAVGLLSHYYRQYRIILSADTASEVRQMPSQKRR